MGAILGPLEGGYAVTGNSNANATVFTSHSETSVCKAEGSVIIHTGMCSKIYNDVPLQTNMNGEVAYNYATDWDEDGRFTPAGENTLITTGFDNRIITGICNQYDSARFLVIGDESSLEMTSEYCFLDENPVGTSDHEYKFPIHAVIDGYKSSAVNAYNDERVIPTGSVLVSLGKENELQNPGVDSVLASFGDNSRIESDDDKTVEYIFSGGEGSVIDSLNEESLTTLFIAKKAKSVEVSGEVVLMSKQSPEYFSVGKGSVVAIGWHDGSRNRISVFYEDKDIQAGKKYRVDENGQAVEVK